MRKSAFTLVELLTVVGIIMILLGAAMSGLSVIMSRTSYFSGINAHLNLHTCLSTLAKKSGNSGRVYGYRLQFATVGTVVAATAIYPWYTDNGGAVTYFTSGTAMNSLLGIGLEASADAQSTPNYFYDISDKILASQKSSSPRLSNWRNTTADNTVYTNSTYFMITLEPGTGFMHAVRDASIDPVTSFDITKISLSNGITYDLPDTVEFNYFNVAKVTPARRLALYQDGSAEIKGAR